MAQLTLDFIGLFPDLMNQNKDGPISVAQLALLVATTLQVESLKTLTREDLNRSHA